MIFGVSFLGVFTPRVAAQDTHSGANREVLQSATTSKHYFSLSVAEETVVAVNVFKKETGQLLQTIVLDCSYVDESVRVEDYNFDDHEDFSVFESSYAGGNTSRVYILWNEDRNEYVFSKIFGTSLTFDKTNKVIVERNQCCAGSSFYETVYKLVNDQMVQIEKKCFAYNAESNTYVKTLCE